MNVIRHSISFFPWGKHKFCIQGNMPERALLRLKRAQIPVYNVKKMQKNEIVLLVNAKDCQKVFAIFPSVCYNIGEYTPYIAQKTGAVGLAKYADKVKNRIGLFLGAVLFCVGTLYADGLVFGVKITGEQAYAREARMALDKHGIKMLHPYNEKKADSIAAELLRVKGVEFCSLQKHGLFVYVEMQTSPFLEQTRVRGDMKAKYSGTLLSLTALSGTLLKKAGDSVQAGDALVGAYVQTESGERKSVDAVARAYIACTYEQSFDAATQEQAFAQAYLQMALTDNDTLQSTVITPLQTGYGYQVRCEYVAVQTINL